MDRPKYSPELMAQTKGAAVRAVSSMFAQLLAPELPGNPWAGSSHRNGPGRRSVHSIHRYINDPRRKDWSHCRWGSKP